jgi:hypothetical protein
MCSGVLAFWRSAYIIFSAWWATLTRKLIVGLELGLIAQQKTKPHIVSLLELLLSWPLRFVLRGGCPYQLVSTALDDRSSLDTV